MLMPIGIEDISVEEDDMTKPYKSIQSTFADDPQMATKFLNSIADLLDHGYCVELKRNRDGTPKIIKVKREVNTLAG